LIQEQLADCPGSVTPLLQTFSSCSGKMLRPGLLLLSAAGCGKVTPTHLRLAAVVEIIHNATLLHDDVIDQGQTRRGGPTVNRLWGNTSAVLLGDSLLSRAFEMCADLPPQTVGIIAETASRMCAGELQQLAINRRHEDVSEQQYIEIITGKTAVFFRTCCHLGAMLSGADRQQIQRFADYGLNTGIAFQITDDLLDIVASEDQTGKTQGADTANKRLTLAAVHLLRTAPANQRALLVEELNNATDDKQALVALLNRFGSLQYTRQRARDYAENAIRALEDVKQTKARTALIETAMIVAGRAS